MNMIDRIAAGSITKTFHRKDYPVDPVNPVRNMQALQDEN
jgi:hypothetical protein